jgi:uncharacterized protein YjiS (DUF1127 family)
MDTDVRRATSTGGTVILALAETIARRRQRLALDSLASMDFLCDIGLPEVRDKARG